jgi:serine/threonine protein kinase
MAEAILPDPLPLQLGAYRIAGLAGRGAVGEVYRARAADGTRVALKVLRPDRADDRRCVEVFRQECWLAPRLAGEHLPRILEVGKVEGRAFVAMEYVAGQDLSRLLERARAVPMRLGVEPAVAIAVAVCCAVRAVSEARDEEGRPLRLVHRDLSPPNVRIDWEGAVKLIDLGGIESLAQPSLAGKLVRGKLGYASPEQLRRLPMDRRSHVFSIGVMLHEMLTGRPLFPAVDADDLLAKLLSTRVAAPSRFGRPLPAQLDQICLRALELEPDRRQASAHDLGEELEAVRRTLPPEPPPLGALLRRLFPDEHAADERW